MKTVKSKLTTVLKGQKEFVSLVLRSFRSKPVFASLFLLSSLYASAAGDVATQIGTWGDTIATALNAGVGVFAVVGGFIIFTQYMQGNDSAQKNFIKFVIGLAIFGLVTAIANTFLTAGGTPVPV